MFNSKFDLILAPHLADEPFLPAVVLQACSISLIEYMNTLCCALLPAVGPFEVERDLWF